MADRARGMLDYNEGSYPEPSQCDTCKWRHRGNMNTVACEAFPEGISLRILANKRDHRKGISGDGGFQWEPRESNDQHPLEGTQ